MWHIIWRALKSANQFCLRTQKSRGDEGSLFLFSAKTFITIVFALSLQACTIKMKSMPMSGQQTLGQSAPATTATATPSPTAAPATHLVFTTQPSASTASSTAFATQPVVTIEDANGNTVTTGSDSTATITLSLTTGTGTLGGTVSMNAVAGVANFAGKGLNINRSGSDKVLTASATLTQSGAVTTTTSPAFTITASAATHLVFTTQPSASTASSTAFATQPVVTIEDLDGNTVTTGANSTASITLTLTTGTGTLAGTVTMNAVAGVADFAANGLNIDLAGSNKVLTATATLAGVGVVTTTTAPAFSIVPGAAAKIVFTTQPSASTVMNTAFAVQPVVTIEDLAGNTVDTGADSTVSITLSLHTGTGVLGGTSSMNAVAGVADFLGQGLNIDTIGTNKILQADATLSGPGAVNTLTSSFIITVVVPDLTDDDNTMTGFAGGSFSGVNYGLLADGSSSGLKLSNNGGCNGSSTNCSQLDSTWTPRYGNLLGYWKMDNNWNDPVGGNNGAIHGTPNFSAGAKIGTKAGAFILVGDYVTTGLSMPTTDFSVAFWYNPSSIGGAYANRPFGSGDSGSGNHGLDVAINDGTNNIIIVLRNNGANSDFPCGATPSINAWEHIVITVSSVDGAKCYRNGVLTGSNAAATVMSIGALTAHIGSSGDGGSSFLGRIDDLAIWGTPLTSTNITSIYDRQSAIHSGVFTSRVMDALTSVTWNSFKWITTLPFFKELPDYASGSIQNESTSDYSSLASSTLMTGIVGLWHMNEASWIGAVNEIVDHSGMGNHGSAMNGVTPGTGRFNRGAAGPFATNQFLRLQNGSFPSGSAPRTLSIWFKLSQAGMTTDNQAMFSVGSNAYAGARNDLYYMYSGGQGTLNVEFAGVYVGFDWNPDTSWHHFAAVYPNGQTAANQFILYLDGVAQTNTIDNTAGALLNTTQNPAAIGGLGTISSGYEFQGDLDEAAIWTRDLSATEIKQLYQRGGSRIKYQIKSCSAADCSDNTTWAGPDGTSQSYYSELYNMSSQSASPSGVVRAAQAIMQFLNFAAAPADNQYFQYRAILESDSNDSTLMPEIKSVVAAGGTYATWNPADRDGGVNLSVDNLTATVTNMNTSLRATVGKSTGKWYWEVTAQTASANEVIGIANLVAPTNQYTGQNADSLGVYSNGGCVGSVGGSTGCVGGATTYTIGDTLGFALDMDAGTLIVYKNGVQLYTVSGITGTIYPAAGAGGGTIDYLANFGASSFLYTVPTGYNPGLF